MAKQTSYDKVLATLGGLTPGELARVKGVIEQMLDHYERRTSDTQLESAVKEATQLDLKSDRRGSVEYKWIPRKRKDGSTAYYGPYKYLRYWDNGHYRSVYLGKANQKEAENYAPPSPTERSFF